jgi:molybdate transport system substrate-binding protein
MGTKGILSVIRTLLVASLLAAAASAEELVVASAISLREPATRIGAAFETDRPGARVRFSFGGTNLLAAQVRAGAPIDVLLSADERIVEGLVQEGMVPGDARFELARNRLVVVEPGDARLPLDGPEDLARADVRRIAVPESAVPVGRYARDWLERRGLLAAVLPRLVPTEHARATLAAVDYGHVDAAIVYATDARIARSAVVAFEVPAAEQPRIRYLAARMTHTPRRELADAFLTFLRGAIARASLEQAGFGLPEAP